MKDLILQSLEAHRKFVLNSIQSKKSQLYYDEMFSSIQRIVQSFDNYYGPVLVLEIAFAQLRAPRFSSEGELKYKRLALKHATDVILSINRRFNVKN